MPNHCINELIFRSVDSATQDRILAATCNAEGKVDFQILVPIPLNVWRGSVGQEHERAFKTRIGMNWQIDNWGTKWNAYDSAPAERTDDTLTIRFQTAWCPPYPWLAAVFNHLGLDFEHNWLSEGGSDGVSGRFWNDESRWGDEWREEPASPEIHRRLHKLLWGVEEFATEANADA